MLSGQQSNGTIDSAVRSARKWESQYSVLQTGIIHMSAYRQDKNGIATAISIYLFICICDVAEELVR